MTIPKTTMTSRSVVIERCYFPYAKETHIRLDGDTFELKDALVIPIADAIRLGFVRITPTNSGSVAYELVAATTPTR